MHQRSISSPVATEEASSSSSSSVELTPMLTKRLVGWQKLSIVLRSSRAFYQASKIIAQNQDAFFNKFSRSLSYTAIDVEPECFSRIDKLRLSKLVRDKNTDHLDRFGGIQGLVSKLKTDVRRGIESNDEAITLRRQTFGSNTIQLPSPETSRIVLETFKDPILVILFLCASLSLGFGIRREGLRGVADGLSIYVSIFLVMMAISFSNVCPTRQFHALAKSNIHATTVVIRDGTKQRISANDAVVGDLVHLQAGDEVPADGLYVEGNSFQVNELTKEAKSVEITPGHNPFLLAGSKVTNGYAQMVVTAVGMELRCPTEDKTPLQVKLHQLTHNTAKIGLAVASTVLIILLIKYFTGRMKDSSGAADYTTSKSVNLVCQAMIGILVMPIVIATAAIPEGLLLAATITLAYSTKRMAAEKAIVRNLAACEAIGSITVICIEKSGALSSKSPKVEQFWLGQMKFKRKSPPIARAVLQLLHEAIGLNATSSVHGELQTEKAICSWAEQELEMNLEQLKKIVAFSILKASTSRSKLAAFGYRETVITEYTSI